jgi:DNA-binding response OmpR family regulator
MQQYAFLIADTDLESREFVAGQLDADGHEVHLADSAATTTVKLTAQAIDVLLLGDLERAADALTLLRRLRAGELHTRIHRAQPAITIGAVDELSILRAYDAGSDHHLGRDSGYLVLRAVLAAVARRTIEPRMSRHLHVGELHIDIAARTVHVGGTLVRVSVTEFALLTKLASDPTKVFTKAELGRARPSSSMAPRTVDSHMARLRHNLEDAGAKLIHTERGVGWALTRAA